VICVIAAVFLVPRSSFFVPSGKLGIAACSSLMEPGLTVYRHDSPGGRIVIITVDERDPGHVVARLQVERRADPERQGVGEPPLIAEARGPSREAVLTELRALADDDAELARRLARWTAMQRRPRSDVP
jgi:hypothetical protein